MSTSPLTSTVGAIDVTSLVSSLMSNEAQELTPLTNAAASYNAELSAYSSVSSALSTYQTALTQLNSAAFSAQSATIANSGTGTGITTSAFTTTINSTADISPQSQIIQSAGMNAATIFNAGDSIALQVGTGTPTFVTLSSNTTLAGLASAINGAQSNVVASITTDGSGSHLVLQATNSGTANTIQVSSNGSLSSFAYNPTAGTPSTMTQTQAPQDQLAAISGSYNISVTSLAASEKLQSAAIPDGTTFSSGLLAIKTGTGATAVIQPTSNTLSGIRDAINASDAGVNATIVDDGTNSHLILTSQNSGAANTITVTGTGDYASLSSGSYTNSSGTVVPSTMKVQQAAQDATVIVDGVPITSSSNTITNAVNGVTLNLNSVTTASDNYALTIGNNPAGVQTTVQSFVSAYNTLIGVLNPLNAYDATTQSAGALQGDSTLTMIQNQIRNALIQPVGDSGPLQTLNDVGVSLQADGTLALNATTLTAATTNSFNDISALFNSPTDGIVTSLNTLLTSMLAPTTGIVANRTAGLQSSLATNAANQATMQTQLTADQAMYTAEFTALNVTLTTMQSTQAALTTELAGLTTTS
jgi:flagellar hook-associated protein 2